MFLRGTTVLRPTLVYGPAQGEDLFLSQLIRAVLAGRPFAMTAGEKYRVKELQDYVKKVTAPYKYPREIEFVDILPKTVSGKIRRVQLREMEWARKGKKRIIIAARASLSTGAFLCGSCSKRNSCCWRTYNKKEVV